MKEKEKEEMSWLGCLEHVSNVELRSQALAREEKVERTNIAVEATSTAAFFMRTFRQEEKNIANGVPRPDSDDDDNLRTPKSDYAVAQRAMNAKMRVERQQVEWDVFETRARELRRMISDEQRTVVAAANEGGRDDPAAAVAVVDDTDVQNQLLALRPPASPLRKNRKKKQLESPSSAERHRSSDRALVLRSNAADGDDACAAGESDIVQDPAVITACVREEGFARASFVMEERSCRQRIHKAWLEMLTKPDADLLVRYWNRNMYESELQERLRRRTEVDAAEQERLFRESTAHHRAMAMAQNQRVMQRRKNRDRLLAIECEEDFERLAMVQQRHEWFRRFLASNASTITNCIQLEEALHRCAVESAEAWTFSRTVAMVVSLYQLTERLDSEAQQSRQTAYEEASTDILRALNRVDRQRDEDELQLRRRDVLRAVADAQERERLKLELMYGASPLKEDPCTHRLTLLRPEDELEVIAATHPFSGVEEALRSASRRNQENNALYMALDRRHIRISSAKSRGKSGD